VSINGDKFLATDAKILVKSTNFGGHDVDWSFGHHWGTFEAKLTLSNMTDNTARDLGIKENWDNSW
jgi:hypothetical protein